MNEEELRRTLANLQLELLNLEPDDAETQERVHALLENLSDPDKLPETEEDQASLQQLLEESVTHFERRIRRLRA